MIESNNIPNDQGKNNKNLIVVIGEYAKYQSRLLEKMGIEPNETAYLLSSWAEACKKGDIDPSRLDVEKKWKEAKRNQSKILTMSRILGLIGEANESLKPLQEYYDELDAFCEEKSDEDKMTESKMESMKEVRDQIVKGWANMEEKELEALEGAIKNDIEEMRKRMKEHDLDAVERRKALMQTIRRDIYEFLEAWGDWYNKLANSYTKKKNQEVELKLKSMKEISEKISQKWIDMKKEELEALKESTANDVRKVTACLLRLREENELGAEIKEIINNLPLDSWKKSYKHWEMYGDIDEDIKSCIESMRDVKSDAEEILTAMTPDELKDFSRKTKADANKIEKYFSDLKEKYDLNKKHELAKTICRKVDKSPLDSWIKFCSEWQSCYGEKIDERMISKLERARDERDKIKGKFTDKIGEWNEHWDGAIKELMQMKEEDLWRLEKIIWSYEMEEYFSKLKHSKLKFQVLEGINEARELKGVVRLNDVPYVLWYRYDELEHKVMSEDLHTYELEGILKRINQDIEKLANMPTWEPGLTAREARDQKKARELESKAEELQRKIERALDEEIDPLWRRIRMFHQRFIRLNYSQYELGRINEIIKYISTIKDGLAKHVELTKGTMENTIKDGQKCISLTSNVASMMERCSEEINDLRRQFVRRRANDIMLDPLSLARYIEFFLALVNYVLLKIESMLPESVVNFLGLVTHNVNLLFI